jgi:hypothetical protein
MDSEHRDLILKLDKQQGREDAARCGVDPDHGRLTAHGTGQALVCGVCGYHIQAILSE